MVRHNALATAAAVLGLSLGHASPLAASPGETSTLAGWDIQSTSSISKNLAGLSKPGAADVSSWHHTDLSRCTLMGCLLDAGVYKDEELWHSDNLNHFNWGQFTVPWVYRTEFALAPKSGRHFILETHGITSKGDIFLNGKQIAKAEHQAGAFGGHTYDITKHAADRNALLVQVHPTNYMYDLAVGFVDWNPYPPDNGTGVWRDITVKQTGPVSMGPVAVTVDIDTPVERSPAEVAIHATAQNLEDHAVQVDAEAVITEPTTGKKHTLKQTVKLGPGATKKVKLAKTLDSPQVWWPKLWGQQPLYKAKVTFNVASEVSDSAETTFGVRKVTSVVNQHNDTIFTVNGHPFQVVGGGYGADMFLRWDSTRFTTIAKYMLDMGLNTIRLEGMMEQPELYSIADEIGLMVIAGWECCTKWEAWEYNHDLSVDPVPLWNAHDFATANASMAHEAAVMQPHPSMLGFLVGSDFWPNDAATDVYMGVLAAAHWQTPVIASASKRGYPEALGPSGMKMAGPYDWVPPNYWYDMEPATEDDRFGAAFGFGSELGAGVGTPELGSLKRFLTDADLDDLWTKPHKGLFHMSNNVSQFYDRKIYNDGLYRRYGKPASLDDYLLKAQMMDYEATRSQHEGFGARWNAARPATGTIYWMLNNAWPSLHWNQFDHYMHPAGSYFGTKVGSRPEHIVYDYVNKDVWLVNRSLDRKGARSVAIEVVDLNGKTVSSQKLSAKSVPNKSINVGDVKGLSKAKDVVFVRLVLGDSSGKTLSRNVYWVPKAVDGLKWADSTWYHTPVSKYADLHALSSMKPAVLSVKTAPSKCKTQQDGDSDAKKHVVTLENKSDVPAFFVRLNLVDGQGHDVNPVMWSDNYVTLWPHEKLRLQVTDMNGQGSGVQVSGGNVKNDKVDF